MPEARLARARQTLPEGYQFGDAGPSAWWYDERVKPHVAGTYDVECFSRYRETLSVRVIDAE